MNISLCTDFLAMAPKTVVTMVNIYKWDHNKLRSLYKTKEIIRVERQPTEQEEHFQVTHFLKL